MNRETYRVLPRRKAALIGIGLFAGAAVVIWLALRWINASTVQFGRLLEQTPGQAATEIVWRVRLYAWLYGGSLFAIAAWIAWIASRAIRTARMPPPGSWIIEGQRTWAGEAAMRRGRILLIVAGALALLAGGLFVSLWMLAGAIAVPAQ